MGATLSKKKAGSSSMSIKSSKLYTKRHLSSNSKAISHKSSVYKQRPSTPSPPATLSTIESITHDPKASGTTSFLLPDDWDTKEYQYNLHFALKALFGGTVTPAIAQVLKKGSCVLQMGTCSGPWMMDMATQFPDCQFTCVELTGLENQYPIPSLPNISFLKPSQDNIAQIKDNSVSFIHLRSIGTLLTRDLLPGLFKEINRILKPNGMIQIEEVEHSPKGTVMIESFVETIRTILDEMNFDSTIARKYGHLLQSQGFQLMDSKKKRVHYASDGKLSQEFVKVILSLYESKSASMAPKMGLELEDYRHRTEMICAECVRTDAHFEWYSYIAKKPSSSGGNI